MQPYEIKFKAIEKYKQYAGQKDKFLVYKVDENKQIVFRSSIVKVEVATKMSSSINFLAGEFCHFSGKVNKTRHLATLITSFCHPLLQKTNTVS